MYILTVFILTRDGRKRRLNYGMLGASTMLILLSSTVRLPGVPAQSATDPSLICLQEMFNNIVRLIRAYLYVGPHISGGPEAFFGAITEPTFIVKGCLHPIQILLLDGVVVCSLQYRMRFHLH